MIEYDLTTSSLPFFSQSVEKSATPETDCALLKARDGIGAMTALSFKYEIIRKPERFLGFSQP